MYSEIYDGFMDILNRDPSEKVLSEMQDFGHVPHYLNISFGFEPEKIKRVKRIKIKDQPDIVLVLAFSPNEGKGGKYTDYVVIDGELCKIILIDMNSLVTEEINDQAYMITWCIYVACLTVAERYKYIVDNNYPYALGSLIYYAPAVLIAQIFRKLYKDLDAEKLYAIIGASIRMYSREEVGTETIDSIMRAIDDTSISLLLDCSLLLKADESVYPGLRFADGDDSEEDDEEQEDE